MAAKSKLDLLEEALAATIIATRWRSALAVLPPGAPETMFARMVMIAHMAEDVAFDAANKVRVALGGEPLPDPADPPPVRPDD